MPTGYTSEIAKGITFEEFAMRCARQFGACIDMRDEPNNAEIPERFEPSDYHAKKIEEAKERIEHLKRMPLGEAEQKAFIKYEKEVESNRATICKDEDLKNKYEDMLLQAKKWEPPTPDHTGMKDFMISQIEGSIEWDCDHSRCHREVEKLSGEEWLNKKLAKSLHDLDHHTKENQEEIERTELRNRWVRLLRESLK